MLDEQTQDQDPEGEGQGDGQQSSQVSSEDYQASQQENVELKKNLSELSRNLKKAEGEAKTHQRRADRLANAMVTKPVTPPTQTQGRVPARRQQQQSQQAEPEGEGEPDQMTALAEYANESAKEASLLREVLKRGLQLEEVEDIEFDSPSELAMKLDVIQQNNEIANLKLLIEAQETPPGEEGETGEGASGDLQIDSGGASGSVGDKQVLRADELRKKAQDLRAQGKYKEATWLSLRASHVDPNKIIQVQTPGEEF